MPALDQLGVDTGCVTLPDLSAFSKISAPKFWFSFSWSAATSLMLPR